MEEKIMYLPREYANSAKVLGTDTAILVNGDLYGINITNNEGKWTAICPDLEGCQVAAGSREIVMQMVNDLIPKCEKKKINGVKKSLNKFVNNPDVPRGRKMRKIETELIKHREPINDLIRRIYTDGFNDGMKYQKEKQSIRESLKQETV